MNLNEVTYYSDPVDQWAARREWQLRAQAYTAWRIGESLRLSIEGFEKMGKAMAALAPHMQRLREAALVLDGVPLELQREVLAITRGVDT